MKKNVVLRQYSTSAVLAAFGWVIFGALLMYALLKFPLGLERPDGFLLAGSGVIALLLWIHSLVSLGWGRVAGRPAAARDMAGTLLDTAGDGASPRDLPLPGRIGGLVFFGALVAVSGFVFSMGMLEGLNRYSQDRFTQARTRFLQDPNGFGYLQRYAADQFKLQVVLGGKNDNWANTSLWIPDASPANMGIRPGYCLLGFNTPNIARSFMPKAKVDLQLWMRGVAMHEFGHCVDMSRDLPPSSGEGIHPHSIAPADAKRVTDFASYVEAENRDSTVLWREAYADSFAVGYWRLHAQAEARGLVNALLQLRDDNRKTDKTHSTMCWIREAWTRPLPASDSALREWADAVRQSPQCAHV